MAYVGVAVVAVVVVVGGRFWGTGVDVEKHPDLGECLTTKRRGTNGRRWGGI